VKKIILILGILLLASQSWAAHLKLEKEYQREWCERHGGVLEYVLDDRARVDCLTEDYAIEFDFGPKWAEAIGQALYYAAKTNRMPGVVLIMEFPGDEKYLHRLQVVAQNYGIWVWTVRE